MNYLVTSLELTFPQNLIETIQSTAVGFKPHLDDDLALQTFLQDLFIRVFMDLQPHDLTLGAIAGTLNSQLTPMELSLELSNQKQVQYLQNQLTLIDYGNLMNAIRKRMMKQFHINDVSVLNL